MRESNESLANRIFNKVKNCPEPESDDAVRFIATQITWQMDDAFKMIKNINQTSLNEQDRFNRIIELESKFGIPKTHLIIKQSVQHFKQPASGNRHPARGFGFVQYGDHVKTYAKGLEKGCEISRESSIEAARQIIKEANDER